MANLENKENQDPLVKSNNETELTTASNQQLFNEIDHYENRIIKLRGEIEAARKESAYKTQCLRANLQEKKSDHETCICLVKTIEQLEEKLQKQNTEMSALCQKLEQCTAHLEKHKINCAEMIENYERSKCEIEDCKKKELNLLEHLEGLQKRFPVLNAQYAFLKEQCKEDVTSIKIKEENDHQYKRVMANLQSMVKRMEIKVASLETTLQKESEECIALSNLYEDIIRG